MKTFKITLLLKLIIIVLVSFQDLKAQEESNKKPFSQRKPVELGVAPESTLSRISVKGNQFVDENGKTMVFRGVNTKDPYDLYLSDHWNPEYFGAIKNWGANIVRFPVHPRAWRELGIKEYLGLLDQGIKWADSLGIYVVMDWHSIGNLRSEVFFLPGYETTRAETFKFWRVISDRYKNNTTVAFLEFYNEPTTFNGKLGSVSWMEWKEIVEEGILIMRANGSKAVPLVAGFNWGYDLTPIAENPIDAEGVAYVSHPYPQKRPKPWEEKWEKDWGYVADKYPLMLTEIGFCGPDDKGAHVPVISEPDYVQILTDYCDKKGISYVVWVFDTSWDPALLKDWSYEPTWYGEYWRKALREHKGK